MINSFLLVGLGGGLGAMLRYGLVLAVSPLAGGGFPVAILSVNVIGSFLMGLGAVWLGQKGLDHLSPLFLTGILGGFTTFSAFSLEAVSLWERSLPGQALVYVGLSVALSIGALVAGAALMRGWLA